MCVCTCVQVCSHVREVSIKWPLLSRYLLKAGSLTDPGAQSFARLSCLWVPGIWLSLSSTPSTEDMEHDPLPSWSTSPYLVFKWGLGIQTQIYPLNYPPAPNLIFRWMESFRYYGTAASLFKRSGYTLRKNKIAPLLTKYILSQKPRFWIIKKNLQALCFSFGVRANWSVTGGLAIVIFVIYRYPENPSRYS